MSDQQASLVATVLQAGYAGGLLFIVPAGDIVKRRPFVLALVFGTALLVSESHVSTPMMHG